MARQSKLSNFSLRDGRRLTLSYSQASPPSRKWLVYLPGSGASLSSIHDKGFPKILAQKFSQAHLLIINKAGIRKNSRVQQRIFESSSQRQTRIEDVLGVLDLMLPTGAEVCLIGYSEGAYIAPEVALRSKRVKALLLLGGGTRSWIEEELVKMDQRVYLNQQNRLCEIYSGCSPLKRWQGFSHQTWLSYDTDATLKALKRIQVPTLSIYGSQDDVIDRHALRHDFKKLSQAKPKLISARRLNGLDHHFDDCWDRVYQASCGFLNSAFV